MVLILEDISQLITDTLGITNRSVNIPVRMTIDPVINLTICNEVSQLRCEGTIDRTTLKLFRHKSKRWNMMCGYNNVFSLALGNCLLYEIKAFQMLFIEAFC